MRNSLRKHFTAIPWAAYLELTKPRILLLILITTALGFFLAANGKVANMLFLFTMLGAGLTCAGASALNHYIERDADGKMTRTRNRPVPSGIIPPNSAMLFGVYLTLIGIGILYWKVNLLTAFLSLLTAFLYVLVYTPLKKISWLNTLVGAIPGAIPPMGGWAAAQGQLPLEAWILFGILFVWQHPHFFAIAWMCREDYKLAGFKMLPVLDPSGRKTFSLINIFSVLLIFVAILPGIVGMSGKLYLGGAVLLSVGMLYFGMLLSKSRSHTDAKNLLRATVFYLPLLFLLVIVDGGF